MHKPAILLLLLLAGLLSACQPEVDHEARGRQLLSEARQAYAQGRYAAARDTIMSLRAHHPQALEARRQAILLLDSVELMDARRQQDTLKAEFFQRKLQHDIEKLRK